MKTVRMRMMNVGHFECPDCRCILTMTEGGTMLECRTPKCDMHKIRFRVPAMDLECVDAEKLRPMILTWSENPK